VDNISIKVENVTKTFRLRQGGTPTLKSAALDFFRGGRRKRDFIALKDVSFAVGKGETLGIIGANGAGKSTLLSIITGTMSPTSGTVVTNGTISSLLELGAGFHPDLTGRENVFLNGAIMGIPRKQMTERFDAIVEFAGIENFIDQPVKHYSSGMYVRLGFAVAVEVAPDILLIDEVLAVGDADFQRKCIQKIGEFRERGKTMLIISHDLRTIQKISDRILLLDEGRILGMGDPANVVDEYESLNRKRNAKLIEREWGTGEVKITGVDIVDQGGAKTNKFKWGAPLEARIHYHTDGKISQPVFGFAISDEGGRIIYGNNTQIEKFTIPEIAGDGTVALKLEKLAMAKGTYRMSFSVHSSDHKINYHRLDNKFTIEVESDKAFEGYCYMPVKWKT
jgi:ABC-type polysaccharide/polyol phosphate transport system ATPase subunit